MSTTPATITVRVDTLSVAEINALSDRFDRAANDPRFGAAQRRFFGDLADRLVDHAFETPRPRTRVRRVEATQLDGGTRPNTTDEDRAGVNLGSMRTTRGPSSQEVRPGDLRGRRRATDQSVPSAEPARASESSTDRIHQTPHSGEFSPCTSSESELAR